MIEEIKIEIENAKNLPRCQRRKKEKELQIKYNDKSIKVISKKFDKGEPLNREQRRGLLKDKNLIMELTKIITKYFPEFIPMLENLSDDRNKSYVTYNMKTLIFTKNFPWNFKKIQFNLYKTGKTVFFYADT